MACLGTGNGSVFQLVPQRFGKEIGVATGVVGAAGGLGGFFLPTLLGGLKSVEGSYAPGLLLFALVAACAMTALLRVRQIWRASWADAEFGRRLLTATRREVLSQHATLFEGKVQVESKSETHL